MAFIDLQDPEARAEAIRLGYVWNGPTPAQEAAIQDIASGRVPVPAYLPDYAKGRIAELTGKPVADPYAVSDGAGPQ